MEAIIDTIKACLPHTLGEYSVVDIMTEIAAGRMIALETKSGIIIISVDAYPQKKILRLCMAQGFIDEHAPETLSLIEQLARDLSCSNIVIEGRRGWARQLRQFGYTEQYVTISKEVTP